MSGGDTIIVAGAASLTLMRTGTTNPQTNTTFFLTAAFTRGAVPQEGIRITGGQQRGPNQAAPEGPQKACQVFNRHANPK